MHYSETERRVGVAAFAVLMLFFSPAAFAYLDPMLVEQILWNLFQNARDAMLELRWIAAVLHQHQRTDHRICRYRHRGRTDRAAPP